MFRRPPKAQENSPYLETINELQLALKEKELEVQYATLFMDSFENHLTQLQEELNNTFLKMSPDSEKYHVVRLLHEQRTDELLSSIRQMLQSKKNAEVNFTKQSGITLEGELPEKLEQSMTFLTYRLGSIQHFLSRLAAGERISTQEIQAAFKKDELLAKGKGQTP